MVMTTQVTLTFEGPPSCIDCQRAGVPVCDHIGFNHAAWIGMHGQGVHVPGLDPGFPHIVRDVEISPDRKSVTLTVDTERPPVLELARHLSTLIDHAAKASVRAVHHETGDVLAEGRYDRFLTTGQEVCINGDPHMVQAIEHPNRTEHGTTRDGLPDVQVATLTPIPPSALQPGEGVELTAAAAAELHQAGGPL